MLNRICLPEGGGGKRDQVMNVDEVLPDGAIKRKEVEPAHIAVETIMFKALDPSVTIALIDTSKHQSTLSFLKLDILADRISGRELETYACPIEVPCSFEPRPGCLKFLLREKSAPGFLKSDSLDGEIEPIMIEKPLKTGRGLRWSQPVLGRGQSPVTVDLLPEAVSHVPDLGLCVFVDLQRTDCKWVYHDVDPREWV
jgi:hypothetical protein